MVAIFILDSLSLFGDPLGEGRAKELYGAVSGLDTGGVCFRIE